MDVTAGELIGADFLQALGAGVVRRRQVRRSQQQFRHLVDQHLQRHFAGLAGRDGGGFSDELLLQPGDRCIEAARALAIDDAALEFTALVRGQSFEALAPIGVGTFAALADRAPGVQHIVGNFERAVVPAQRLLGASQLFGAQRFAVRLGGAGACRRAETDGGLAGDQRRPIGFLGLCDGLGNRLGIVAVDLHCVPAMGLEARHLVDAVSQAQRPVDRDAVVVIEENQLRQLEMAGHGHRFVTDALHQVAVRAQHIGEMIDHLAAELGREHALAQRKADRRRNPLAERAGGGFHPRGVEILRVARRQ